MERFKPSDANLRRFVVSPRNRVLSSPKFDLNKIIPQQEQRARNYIYKKSNLLGQGYSSKVYKAYKEGQLFKPYSIKVIDLTNLSYEQRKNLELQLKIHRSLSHPNIVKCYQTFKSTQTYYLVLEYCPHGTLSDYLKSHKKLEESSVINILCQIIEAYLYLINLSVLHRDLKPQNVIRNGNTWKVIDFGFCCKIEEEMFQGDLNVGTPLYMPLQSLVKNVYSHKSDIYSIGMMTYKMLTGVTPWKCSTQKQLIHLMRTQKIHFPSLKNKYLQQFLHKSLQIEFHARLNVEQFKELYKKIKNEELQLQKLNQLANQLKKYESNRSNTTVQSVNHSNSQHLSQQPHISFNLSSDSSINTKSQNVNEEFYENSLIISSELETCRLIHLILLNIDSFIISDNFHNPETGYEIHCNFKEILITFFYKYVLKKIRILNSYFTNQYHQKMEDDLKFLGFKAWKKFRKSVQFLNLATLVREKFQFYQAEFLQAYIKKSILTIRFINKKFPELSQNNVPLTSKFYSNFLDFLKPEIQNLNNYILDNLQRVKPSHKGMKKDRILAFSYWLRLYLEFGEKYKLLKQIQRLKQIEENSEEYKKYQENNELKDQLEILKQMKKLVRIQFLYNFKQSSLEYKEFLVLRKILPQIFQIVK